MKSGIKRVPPQPKFVTEMRKKLIWDADTAYGEIEALQWIEWHRPLTAFESEKQRDMYEWEASCHRMLSDM